MTNKDDTKGRASRDELDYLHATVAHKLQDALTHDWKHPETGEKTPPPAALINVAVNFLKANGITGAAAKTTKPLDFLKEAALPFFDEQLKEIVEARGRH